MQVAQERLYEHWKENEPELRKVKTAFIFPKPFANSLFFCINPLLVIGSL